jgi:hypothetical protein
MPTTKNLETDLALPVPLLVDRGAALLPLPGKLG